ncbi:MAG: polysaccharide biosynthesis C-terminal domain-containing protein, partial [Synergistaceae bacterium]|nr:polysaccharide biosynthesis C-terminal domain-containing protein [Synergistaceae bacterium]
GEFGGWAWSATSSTLAFSMLGLPGMACSTVIMRALYALSMPREAFKVTAFSVGATAVLSLILVLPMGYNGLALAPGIAFTLSGLLGLWYVRKKLGRPLGIMTWSLAGDYLVALAVIDIAVLAYRFVWPYDVGAGIGMRSLWVVGVIAVSAGAYAGVTVLKGFEEWKLLGQAFRTK